RVYTYLPYDTFLVRMPAQQAKDRRARQARGSSWIGPYHPLYKLSPAVSAVEALPESVAGAKATRHYRPLTVQVYPDADLDAVLSAFRAAGVEGIVYARRGGV